MVKEDVVPEEPEKNQVDEDALSEIVLDVTSAQDLSSLDEWNLIF